MPPAKIFVKRDRFHLARRSMYLREIQTTYPEQYATLEPARAFCQDVGASYLKEYVANTALHGSKIQKSQLQSKLGLSLDPLEFALRNWYESVALPLEDKEWMLLALELQFAQPDSPLNPMELPRISYYLYENWNPSKQTEGEYRIQFAERLEMYMTDTKAIIAENTGVWLGEDLTRHFNWFARRCVGRESPEKIAITTAHFSSSVQCADMGRKSPGKISSDGKFSTSTVEEALKKCEKLFGFKAPILRGGRPKKDPINISN